MTHTESTPTTEPAASLDDLREQLADVEREIAHLTVKSNGLARAIASAEADERDCNHDDGFSSSAPDASQVPHEPTPFDERALDESDAIIDMTGMAVTSTAAVLAIRAAVQYRADQAQARYLAAQHGGYAVGRGRAMVARDTWREVLALVDTVIAERMS
jgi:hypothetical protein